MTDRFKAERIGPEDRTGGAGGKGCARRAAPAARRPAADRRLLTAARVLAAGLLLSSCTLIEAKPPTIEVAAPATSRTISSPEASLGAREHPRIVQAYGGVYSDPKVEAAVARVVGRLVAVSDDPTRTYRITILNSPTVNAFALPGGYVYVTRGLLALAEDSSEVAAVLAHEMGHITAQHAFARQQRAEAAAVVTRVADAVQDSKAARSAVAAAQLSLAKFSQSQELEADKIGVGTLARAGYDPFAAARFLTAMGRFSQLSAMQQSAADNQPDFLSSHPATPERVELATREARQFSGPDVGDQDRDAYLKGLDGMLYGDDPREGYVRGTLFAHSVLGISFRVPEGFTLDNTPKAVLASDGGRIAMRFDGVDVPAGNSLTDYLHSGWVNGLIEDSIRTSTINGLPAATAAAISDGWSFRIGLIRAPGRTYRFIFATANPSAAFESAFNTTLQSFHQLTPEEALALKPLRIRTVRTQPGDTVDSLAKRMKGAGAYSRELFVVLNQLDPAQPLQPGTLVKIVAD